MAVDYIILETSDGAQKRYKSVAYKPVFSKSQSAERTSDGQLDITAGHTYESIKYVLRVPWQTQDSAFGIYSELIAAYKLSNPLAAPSNCIVLIDHHGVRHERCFFMGDMAPEPLTTIIDGPHGWYIVPIEIHISAVSGA